jgi:hypothetical protein
MPLPPIFFDICIDPLIERLSSDEFNEFGYWLSDIDGVIAQVYADHILLFSKSYEGMLKIVQVVQDFIRESNIQLNPKKCKMLKIVKDFCNTFPLTDESIG